MRFYSLSWIAWCDACRWPIIMAASAGGHYLEWAQPSGFRPLAASDCHLDNVLALPPAAAADRERVAAAARDLVLVPD